jgi:hypothetical protein
MPQATEARAIGATPSPIGSETLYALGNLLLVLWVLAGTAGLIAVALAELGGLAVFYTILTAIGAVLSGIVARTLCHWLANMLLYVEALHSNLYQLTDYLLANQTPQDTAS